MSIQLTCWPCRPVVMGRDLAVYSWAGRSTFQMAPMSRVRQLLKGCSAEACRQRQLCGGDPNEGSVKGRPGAESHPPELDAREQSSVG